MMDLAEKNNIPYQQPFIARGGTDAGNMHLAHDEAPAVSLGIPTRYMHSHYSIVHKNDVENAIKLLKLVVENLNENVLKDILT
jgi:endoglucanase